MAGVTGIVTGTARGCLETDIAYLDTVARRQASPLLFSYTLPNIAPSEAAVFFRLEGPVYSVFDVNDPYQAALSESERLLGFLPEVDFMIFGMIDTCRSSVPAVRLNIMGRNIPPESADAHGKGGSTAH